MISEGIDWMFVKDYSRTSFPGDHAVIVLQWIGFLCFFGKLRFGIPATLIAGPFLLPRLIGGAHWFTDEFVGSGSIVLIFLAWATCTPIYPWGMKKIIRGIEILKHLKLLCLKKGK